MQRPVRGVIVAVLLLACGDGKSGSGQGSGTAAEPGSEARSGSGAGSGSAKGSATGSGAAAGSSGSARGGSGSDTVAGSGSVATPGSGSARPVTRLAADADPTRPLVQKAFGGRLPAFPLLSGDGRVAAVELQGMVGQTGVSTYGVAFVELGGTTDAVWLVERTVAAALYDRATGRGSGSAKPVVDEARLARTATAIARRLRSERFAPFDHVVAELSTNDRLEIVPGRLTIAESTGGLAITLHDARGVALRSEVRKARRMGKVADLDCVSEPLPRAFYFHKRSRRVLIKIGWNAGSDQCDSPPAEHRLWELP